MKNLERCASCRKKIGPADAMSVKHDLAFCSLSCLRDVRSRPQRGWHAGRRLPPAAARVASMRPGMTMPKRHLALALVGGALLWAVIVGVAWLAWSQA